LCKVADQKEGNVGGVIKGIDRIWIMAETVTASTALKILTRKPRSPLNHLRASHRKP